MFNRISRSLCSKQAFRWVGNVRMFGGAAAGNPAFKNAPGGYPEVKFRKDVDDFTGKSNDDEAYFCGRKPGTPMEGWEVIYGAVMLILAGAMISMYNDEDTSLEAWARKEAIARKIAVENGEEVVYGKWFYKGGPNSVNLEEMHAAWGSAGKPE